ncbi:MAG: Uma2 family endonuclease [Pyrinomonadaceae bacterium]|nr:Uma2 family endonuclease [Pyrinomonadaceae bacterium]
MTSVIEQLPEIKDVQVEVKPVWEQASKLRLFTAEEYEKLAKIEIFGAGERVELIEGVILKMSPKGDLHAAATDRSAKCFIKRLDERAIVRNQNPIRLNDNSEPEPDIVLAALQAKEYSDHKPAPQDVLLILEVADSTLYTDRQRKGLLYAQAGITHYCILNLKTRELEDYREPSAEGYRSKKTYRADERFALVAFPDVEIAVGELLPLE